MNLFTEVLNALKSVPGVFTNAMLQAIPREVEAGIYAGFLKIKLAFELLVWACQTDNPTALALVVGIANQFITDLETVMTSVSGSAILKAITDSSTMFQKSRELLNAALPQIEALGFNPASPLTKAALVQIQTSAIVAKYAPVAEVTAVEPTDEVTGDSATAPAVSATA